MPFPASSETLLWLLQWLTFAPNARNIKKPRETWWARQDSNLQPSGYEPLALTIELQAPLHVVTALRVADEDAVETS